MEISKACWTRHWRLPIGSGFDDRARVSTENGFIRGRGLSCFVECVGAYPYEGVDIRFAPNGTVIVVTATQSSGQGHETSFAQLVSERLGVPFDRVRIKEGDSSDLPKGLASVGSRSMIMAGSAIAIASDAVIEKGRALASHVLEVSKADLEFRDGSFYVPGTDISISLFDLAMRGEPCAICRRMFPGHSTRPVNSLPLVFIIRMVVTSAKSRLIPRPERSTSLPIAPLTTLEPSSIRLSCMVRFMAG